MNAHAQMSGQVPGRVPNQANPQLVGLSQQKGGIAVSSQIHGMDPELEISRHQMRIKITQMLQRRNNNPYAEWLQRLPELAKRLEDYIFSNAASKDDYMNMTVGTIEQRLQGIFKSMPNNSQSLSNRTSSSSSMSTMIPTPGMARSANMNSLVPCSVNKPMLTTGGSGIVTQTSINGEDSLPASNGSAVPNRYQQSPANISLGSGGNNMTPSHGISRQSSQMIPTPGLNNPQHISMNSESSNGVGFPGMDSTMVSQQQHQKQYVGSQNSRILHTLGGQMGVGLRSNLQQKPSPYGFPNGVMNGSLGLIGNNMHILNAPVTSESYLNATSYSSSPKPFRQQFDRQHHQPILQTSVSHEMLPMAGDGYGMNTADPTVSENSYGSTSSVLSSMKNQNINPMNLHSKSKSSNALLNHNTNLQSTQQPPLAKSQFFDNSQKMNFQAPQSTRVHLLQPQQQIQNFQQQPNQSYGQLAQHHHQQQQLLSETDNLRQSSTTSNFGGHLVSDRGIESQNEILFPSDAEQFQLQELQSQYQQNTSTGNHSKDAPLFGHLAGPQDFHPAFSQDSQQMLHPHKQATESQSDYNSLLTGSQPDALQQGHWDSQPLQESHIPDKSSFKHIQEELQQRLIGQDEAQQPHLDGSITGRSVSTHNVSAPQSSSGIAYGQGNSMREWDFLKQKKWLLFLFHARKCSVPKGACKEGRCIQVQQLLMHMDRCNLSNCGFSGCCQSKNLIEHYRKCRATDCPLCVPVRDFIASIRKVNIRPVSDDSLVKQTNDSWRSISAVGADSLVTKTDSTLCEISEDRQTLKRMKVQHTFPSLVHKRELSPVSVPVLVINQPLASQNIQTMVDRTTSTKFEAVEMNIYSSSELEQKYSPIFDNAIDQNVHPRRLISEFLVPNDVVGLAKEETMLIDAKNDGVKLEVKQEANAAAGTGDLVAGSKSGKPKIKGVSLTELFTPEQIREHIRSLRQWIGQSKAKAEKNQAMEHSMSENSCQLCAVEKLAFEPPPIYCTPCGARIKRNAAYYTMGSGDTRHYFCVPCYNEARGDTIDVDGSAFPKARLEKKKNDEETEEWWVQCDKCEAWQHQICALFNGRRNDGGQAEYTCPNCYMEEIEKAERKPLPQSAVLGAKDLPRTILSDHIEQRLFKRLRYERLERAKHLGKSFDEVPGAEALVVRVVSSVDKKLEVKQHFLEMFQEENYPTEFPYKSKVVLLFQKIEGVEVCLFGMYVQEFGSECQFPNQRRVYLSYLDSVKYFRPDTKTVTGEALRTFVYHEILIGYLEYCKIRGFSSCYIWACPPLKGEDYILYCHPEIQKTPKSDKLREWYLAMLRKASKEDIVVELTNLYDHFFVSLGESKAKVTAARLPYFDGDYWPGAAEDMINQIRQEEDGRKQQKKGKTKKPLTKRALKAAGHSDLTGNASKDALLMQKLGETICPMKEDFIMVHLQHACTHCCLLMVSGTRWVCNLCKNFQLCEKCHDAELRREDRERHLINSREKHVLRPVGIAGVPSDTKDKDEILESEFFDTRQAFLSLCQGNHYQYDTLRRAKHSSMMVLYHLHNPTAPAFVTTCNVCQHDVETGQGWRCEICPDFDVCNSCYQKDGSIDHPHKLTNHPSIADRDAQNQEARQKRVLQLRKMLDLLVHASQCRFPNCQYPNCRKVKGLFRHGMQCKTRASGGCPLCKKMWYLLQLHARACKESDCLVPRCKDLKEHLKRLQQQSDSRRRAAVMEMMRQRAAEVAGSND